MKPISRILFTTTTTGSLRIVFISRFTRSRMSCGVPVGAVRTQPAGKVEAGKDLAHRAHVRIGRQPLRRGDSERQRAVGNRRRGILPPG
jgi:hypothetical protein